MRIRDGLIVVVGIIAIIFGWLQEGSVSFRPSFVIPMSPNRDYSGYNPVRPIITDIDGDGIPEMIAADDKNDYIGIFPTAATKRNTDNTYLRLAARQTRSFPGSVIATAAGYLDPFIKHEKSARLGRIRAVADEEKENEEKRKKLQEELKIKMDEEGKAFNFGNYLFGKSGEKGDKDDPHVVREGKDRKQFIAVLTEYYSLRLLDHRLQELWTADVFPTYKAYITPHSGSIMIRPERIYGDDRGCVIVSVPVGGPNGTEVTLYSAYDGKTGELRWSRVINDFAVSFDIDGKRTQLTQKSLNDDDDGIVRREGDEQQPPATDSNGLPASTIAALTVEPDSGKIDPAALREDREEGLILTANDLSEFHKGESPWEHFRESMIATLPHQFTHTWDLKMVPAAFYKNKGKRKHAMDRRGNSKVAKAAQNKDKSIVLDDDDVGDLGQMIGSDEKKKNRRHIAGDTANRMKHVNRRKRSEIVAAHRRMRERANVIITHSKDGVHAMHLYTGQVIARIEPLKAKNSIYHDVDDDYNVDEITNYIGTRQSVYTRIIKSHDRRMPNIIRHGIEQEVLCKGMIFSGVPTAKDPLFNATICDTPGLFSSMHMLEHFIRGDGAEEVPGSDALALIGSRNIAKEETLAAAPCVVQRHVPKGRGLFMVRRLAVFFVDTGLVTAIDPVSKRVVWRTQTESTFEDLRGQLEHFEAEANAGLNSADEKDARSAIFPHLMPYVLKTNPLPLLRTMRRAVKEKHPYVIAAGTKGFSLINTMSGRIASTVELPYAPRGPAIVADFNGDGINDVVIFTKNAMYGLTAHSHAGGAVIPMLMMTLVALVGFLFLVREVSSSPAVASGESDGADGVKTSRVAAFFAGPTASFGNTEDDDNNGPTGVLPTSIAQKREDAFKAKKVKRSTD